MPRLLGCLCTLVLLAACGNPPAAAAPDLGPRSSPGPSGNRTRAALTALLLQAKDLPDLPVRRTFACAELTRQATPQLALCRAQASVGPHELTSELVSSGRIDTVKVFEVVSAFADEDAAHGVPGHLTSGRTCSAFTEQTRTFQVDGLASPPARPDATGFHYRLTTPDVVGGDVRTVTTKGRFTVLVSGYGQPPAGQALLDYRRAR